MAEMLETVAILQRANRCCARAVAEGPRVWLILVRLQYTSCMGSMKIDVPASMRALFLLLIRGALVIVDELGRGTSTCDGFGIAWTVADRLVSSGTCCCQFLYNWRNVLHVCILGRLQYHRNDGK